MSFKISVQELSKRFNREWIFRRLSYTFESGNTYAITGPNGSGKSTLLQILWGQLPPSSGSILFENNSKRIEIEHIYKHVSIATPYMDLIDEFTLEEQLRFHFKLKSVRNSLSISEVLDAMNLNHARNKFIAHLSSGMKQRVKLGMAFYTDAPLLFLDEPGTNLDKQTFEWYLEQLASVSPKHITLIASNQPAEYPSNVQKIDILSFK